MSEESLKTTLLLCVFLICGFNINNSVTLEAYVPFRSAKLNSIAFGFYFDGWPPGKGAAAGMSKCIAVGGGWALFLVVAIGHKFHTKNSRIVQYISRVCATMLYYYVKKKLLL